jgi:methionine-rich copper-binding protein CopC
MGTTYGRKTAHRCLDGPPRHDFDRLEVRIVLSGSSLNPAVAVSPLSPFLSIVSTSPADLAVLTSSPSVLEVTFDRPIDDFSVGIADFQLVHVESNGLTSPLLPSEALLSESLDPNGNQIDLTLSKPLTQGRYQLLISSDNQLQGTDGSFLASGSSSQVVDDFTFSPPTNGFGTAIDLHTLGPRELAVSGNLDLASDPGDVQYYKFTLAPGHHWLVGLEISAHRDGGKLDASISLFDSQGQLISTANEGLSSDPGDPYLFKGLGPGTYFVGISAKKNLPDASGTYNPSASVLGSRDSGGRYQLDLVADTADQVTHVLGLRLDHADPLSNRPTGLTLQFSGAIDLANLELSSLPALSLVDRAGQSWSLTPILYDSTTGQLSLEFDEPLAPGIYTLELGGSNGLVDLAGRAPVATGLPAGILGSFFVAPSQPVRGDLGPILPGQANSGITTTVNVTQGQPTIEQFVVVTPGSYSIEGVEPHSGVSLSIVDGSGKLLVTGPSDSTTGETLLTASPGVYRIVLTSDSQASSVTLTIRQKAGQFSSLLETGVSQLPALSLRLVTPQPDFGLESNTSTSTNLADAPSAPPVSASASASPGATSGHSITMDAAGLIQSSPSLAIGLLIPGGPSVSGQFFGSGLVGRPSSQSSQITVVGTSGPSGLASVASSSASLARGLIVVPFEGGGELEPEVPQIDLGVAAERAVSPKAGITLEAGLLARSAGSRRADDRTLSDADWISQVFSDALDWIEGTPVEVAAIEPSSEVTGPSATGEPIPAEEGRLESASMASPVGFGVVLGWIAYGSRLRASRRKSAIAGLGETTEPRPLLAGPHRRSRVRVR